MNKQAFFALALALVLVVGFIIWHSGAAQTGTVAASTVAGMEKRVAVKMDSADAAWENVQRLKEAVERAQSKSEGEKGLRDAMTATEAFAKNFPADPRRWDAKVLQMNLKMVYASVTGADPRTAQPDAKELAAMLAAPDASAEVKGEAAYLDLMRKALVGVDPDKPETILALHKEISAYLEKNAAQPRATEIGQMQLQLLRIAEPPNAKAILERLSELPDPQVAMEARMTLVQYEAVAKLKKEPLDLKLPSSDGGEIDFAKLRGKVVLLDFWANWCPICLQEMPNTVKAYNDLHPQGFEIVGVSLDESKAVMQGVQKKFGMTWPQYFEGTGQENQVALSFGITALPVVWLFDKKGILRDTNARGELLAAKVQQLLAEQ